MNYNQRVGINDTVQSAITKLSDGNPGAISVMCGMARLPPGDMIPGGGFLSGVLLLDSLGIYGPGIWMLYKDCCGEDMARLCVLLRAWQLGVVTEAEVRGAASESEPRPLDIAAISLGVNKILGIVMDAAEAK